MESISFLYLSMEDVIAADGLDMKLAIEDVKNTVPLFDAKDFRLPSKVVLRWGETNEDEIRLGRINAMPGYLGGKYNMAGIKWIGSNPENPFKYNLPRASALIILNDPITKIPIAVMDGTIISAMRTGAVTGIAAQYLSKKDSQILGLIGAGVQNHTQLKAVLCTRPNLEKVYIYDINYKRSLTFANNMSKECNIEIIPVKAAEESVINSDIIISATMAKEPVIQEQWIKKGAFYSNVGGHECIYETVKQSNKIVVDNWSEVKHRNVSTIALMANEGLISDRNIYAELGEIVNKKKEGRSSNSEKIYFNSVGMGIEDVSLATRIYKKAKENKYGTELKLWNKPYFI